MVMTDSRDPESVCFGEREREANWVMTDSRDPESVFGERRTG